MIRATRRSIRQDVDGCEVVLTIDEEDLPELLRLAPFYGTSIELHPFHQPCSTTIGAAEVASAVSIAEFAATKPPTQSVAPVGEAFGAVMPAAASKEAAAARTLCDHPWFQQFAKTQAAYGTDHDDLQVAMKLVREVVMKGAVWDSEAGPRFKALVLEYKAWCATKGYRE